MKKYTASVCFILCSFWWLNETSATEKEYPFKHFSVSQGLSQSTVNDIFQDRDGFLWIGTEDGLNKFDGITCTYFKKEPTNNNSLSHSWIWDVAQDEDDNLWVATYNGLNKFDYAQGRILRYLPIDGDSTSISSSRPDCLEFDEDGNLWIGTWGGGLNRYNKTTNTFTKYIPDPEIPKSLPHVLVKALHKDIEGRLWVGTFGGGLCYYNPHIDGFELVVKTDSTLRFQPGNQITAIAEGPENQLWIGTYQNGISVLDKETMTFQNSDEELSSELQNKSITAVMMDDAGRMWIGTQSNGLFIYEDGQYIQIRATREGEGLKSDYIYSIFQESGGTILIGSSGLNLYHKSRIKFTHVQKAFSGVNGLRDNNIWSFAEISPNILMVGTQNAGINILELRNNSFNTAAAAKINRKLSVQYVRTMVMDNFRNVWTGTIGGGVDQILLDENKVSNLNKNIPDSQFGTQLRINALASHDSILYIGTVASGIFIYNQRTGEIYRKRFIYNDTINTSSEYINSLMIDSNENLWIGTWGGGFGVVKYGSDTLKRYLHNDENPLSLSNDIVNTIFEDEKGDFWIGTNFGLNKLIKPKSDTFNSFDEEFVRYFQHHGLSNEVIYAIEEDNHGRLWLSTNKGISELFTASSQFISFGVDDGLQDLEFNARSSHRLHDGRLVFGGINGLNIFHPDSIAIDSIPTSMHITRFMVSGKNINLDSLRRKKAEPTLPYSMNFVTLEYAALDFVAPQKIRYAVKLDGVDDDFIQIGERRFATYSNLSPGRYSFMLKATNRDGIWNNEPLIFNFRISPPFYYTWWFILIVFLLLVSLAYLGVQFKIARVLEIERLRTRIASDLHDDIGSSLTKISMYSELIRTPTGSKNLKTYLTNISLLSREVVGSMSDIVWSIDSRHDNLQDLIDRMKDFALSVCEPASINIHFHIKLDDEKRKLKPIFRQNLYLIFKEAINNIVKHSEASEVQVHIEHLANTFSVKIKDNGVGLTGGKNGLGGHGLPNMETRAKRMGGSISIENHQGLTVTCTAKLHS